MQHMEKSVKVSKPAESPVNLRLHIASLLVAPVKRRTRTIVDLLTPQNKATLHETRLGLGITSNTFLCLLCLNKLASLRSKISV